MALSTTVDVFLSPREATIEKSVLEAAARAAKIPIAEVRDVRVVKRSIDARGHGPRVLVRVELSTDATFPLPLTTPPELPHVGKKPIVVIVGAGPAGLFAALRAIELGLRPIILERGKDVRARRLDLAAITQRGVVDPDSNYCFGEGGAGTYSDGKLYTRSGKREEIARILTTFVAYGASPDILVDAHPHIGTNKLPEIIAAMRENILRAGGEVRFGARVTGLTVSDERIRGVTLKDGTSLEATRVVLATGHSARDIFELLAAAGIAIERKDFALGVRVEHPQSIVDEMRYRTRERGPYLPPASYSEVAQVDGLGVYTFCMCPGGIVAPCATAPGEIVTNGWSPSKRNNPFANSGVVVEVRGKGDDDDPLAGDRLSARGGARRIRSRRRRTGGAGTTSPRLLRREALREPAALELSARPFVGARRQRVAAGDHQEAPARPSDLRQADAALLDERGRRDRGRVADVIAGADSAR